MLLHEAHLGKMTSAPQLSQWSHYEFDLQCLESLSDDEDDGQEFYDDGFTSTQRKSPLRLDSYTESCQLFKEHSFYNPESELEPLTLAPQSPFHAVPSFVDIPPRKDQENGAAQSLVDSDNGDSDEDDGTDDHSQDESTHTVHSDDDANYDSLVTSSQDSNDSDNYTQSFPNRRNLNSCSDGFDHVVPDNISYEE